MTSRKRMPHHGGKIISRWKITMVSGFYHRNINNTLTNNFETIGAQYQTLIQVLVVFSILVLLVFFVCWLFSELLYFEPGNFREPGRHVFENWKNKNARPCCRHDYLAILSLFLLYLRNTTTINRSIKSEDSTLQTLSSSKLPAGRWNSAGIIFPT